jgi:hypothetical protein
VDKPHVVAVSRLDASCLQNFSQGIVKKKNIIRRGKRVKRAQDTGTNNCSAEKRHFLLDLRNFPCLHDSQDSVCPERLNPDPIQQGLDPQHWRP